MAECPCASSEQDPPPFSGSRNEGTRLNLLGRLPEDDDDVEIHFNVLFFLIIPIKTEAYTVFKMYVSTAFN